LRPQPQAVAQKLEKLGLRAPGDFVVHLPMRYEDETRLTDPRAAPAGVPVQVQAKLERVDIAYRPRRQLVVHAEGLVLRFLNFYGSQQKQFQRGIEDGKSVRAYGEVRPGFFGSEMVHPRYRVVDEDEPLPSALTPVYPSTSGLSQVVLRKLVLQALEETELEEILPAALRERLALPDLAESVRLLHLPAPGADLTALSERVTPQWRRVKFDELLAQQLSMRIAYRARRKREAVPLPGDGPLLRRFLAKLPFRLTGAQQRVIKEMLGDLKAPHPMQRLLQGDVGSGKTIVAALGCLAALDAGRQAAVMAPTELLAEQHWRKFSEWLTPLGAPLARLHGGLPAAQKKAVLARLKSGEPLIAIGTHALFQKGVAFDRLALTVVDEQHRFGVQQRLALRKKGQALTAVGGAVPHQLMMSATPIPRTLSMSYFADLDVSVIDELPPGRQPVSTRLVSSNRRAEVLGRIREACAEGQQAYWVCPVIEDSKDDLQTAIDTHAMLTGELRALRIGLLHGRLPPEEKAATMQQFAGGRIHLLVATTVIEVGVDVPNASLMVIEHAERFGLAQLHQLRGRVGRGSKESVCILLYAGPLGDGAKARLKTIHESRDGFEIAQQDLHQRGPGEFLGERQSGLPLLRYADLEADEDLMREAKAAAEQLLEESPDTAGRHVQRWLGARAELLRA
jgi:ATP-dependent DNA helicase RecG